ncbi:hypothetical protein [Sorangium sp. So ce861]
MAAGLTTSTARAATESWAGNDEPGFGDIVGVHAWGTVDYPVDGISW